MARKRSWKAKPVQAPAPKSTPPRNAGKCPACGAPIVWINAEGTITPCEPQRRLILFAFKADENGLPLEDEKPLTLFEESVAGKLVIGRKAHPMEAKRYKDHGDPGKPFAIGRSGHLKECPRWDLWLSGKVAAPTELRPE